MPHMVHVRMDITNPADPHVVVDGHDIADRIEALSFVAERGQVPTLTVQLRPGATLEAFCEVVVLDDTAERLEGLPVDVVAAIAEGEAMGMGGDYTAAVLAVAARMLRDTP